MRRLAAPVILSNVAAPLLGADDATVVGRLPEPWHRGAVAVGAVVFNFVYWGFSFLRMGATGLTARDGRAAPGDGERRPLAVVHAVLRRARPEAGAAPSRAGAVRAQKLKRLVNRICARQLS